MIGSTPVLLDDVTITAIDQTSPVAPTDGSLLIQPDGSGQLDINYGHGTSTDAQTLTLYEGASPIVPTTDTATLDSIATSATLTEMTFNGSDRSKYHAVSVKDPSGNEGPLLPLLNDTDSPGTITDLASS